MYIIGGNTNQSGGKQNCTLPEFILVKITLQLDKRHKSYMFQLIICHTWAICN